ncbi:hypothetical protein HAX54_034266, partial [Datura stramonium]|nr:hypothetical protein [Datura stramonium]
QLEHTARLEEHSSWLYWPCDAVGNLAQGQARGVAVLAQGHTRGNNTPTATARAMQHLSWRDEARATALSPRDGVCYMAWRTRK